MDFSFHLQQGQQLLDKQDVVSVKKALEHFIKANEMTENEHIGKPKILYHLALGNFVIGQIEQSYKIAHKAKRSIDTAIENSQFTMNNFRQMLGEPDIDALIQHIDEKFPQVVLYTDIYDDNFDENDLDLSLLNHIHQTIDEVELKKMSVDEQFQLRRKCSESRDIKSLLTIVKYLFINGSPATNETFFPEMCYYYGRLRRVEELKEFLSDKKFYLNMLPNSCKELAQNLINIGYKFPQLNEQEISYLEQKYCDSKTFELFDIIMFDIDKLSRPINKFDKNLLNVKNVDFSIDFLSQVFKYFSVNIKLDHSYDKLYVYSRIKNEIIQKKYVDIGLGEYCIIQPILSNEFCNLLKEKYGEDCSDYFAKALSYDDNWVNFKESNFYLLNADNLEEVAIEYFSDSLKVEEIKITVAKFWLDKKNSKKIKLV